jgi:thiol-disulfide isomerase/thioredoxin
MRIKVIFDIAFVLLTLVLSPVIFSWPGYALESQDKLASDNKVSIPIMNLASLDNVLQNEGRGKIVMVSFFASWCPPCRKEIPQLVHLRSKVIDNELLILGISADYGLEELYKFLERVKINFPVYLAANDILAKYEVVSIPKMLIFNAKGELFQIIDGAMPEQSFYSMIDYILGSKNE